MGPRRIIGISGSRRLGPLWRVQTKSLSNRGFGVIDSVGRGELHHFVILIKISQYHNHMKTGVKKSELEGVHRKVGLEWKE